MTKLKLLPAIALGCLLTGTIFTAAAQRTVRIVPRKVVYRRPAKIEKYKRTFTVTYPVIGSGSLPRARANQIKDLLDYEKQFEFSLSEARSGEDTWLYEAAYKVNYNRRGILDVTLTIDGSGAYPDTATKNIVIGLNNGERLTARDMFNAAELPQLAAEIDKLMQKAIARRLRELSADGEDVATIKEDLADKHFTVADLDDFTVSDRGLTFHYDFGFPHVSQALEPDGDYFLSFARLSKFIRRDGLLGQFIR